MGTLLFVLWAGLAGSEARIVVSEVMFDPAGSEFTDEFIELQNTGDAPVDLAGWRVGDGEGVDLLEALSGAVLVPPGGFALVLDRDYVDAPGAYGPLPADAAVFTVGDATLGRSGLANEGETIVVLTAAGDTAATLTYAAFGAAGFSFERIDPSGGDGPGNYGPSRWEGGTPGRRNSLSPKSVDLSLSGPGETVALPFGLPRRVWFTVRNEGGQRVAGVGLSLSWEGGQSEVPVAAPVPGESALAAADLPDGNGVRRTFTAVLFARGDEDPTNDKAAFEAVYGAAPGSVRINEVMPAPASGPEWLEVVNVTDAAVDLSFWALRDLSGASGVVGEARPLPPGGLTVIAAGPVLAGGVPALAARGFPVLNDGGDTAELLDATGTVVDRVAYGDVPRGRSAERVQTLGASDASNFLASTAPEGGTPGLPNSVQFEEGRGLKVEARPNPFAGATTITVEGPNPVQTVTLSVFDASGRRVRTLLDGAPSGSRREVVWRGDAEDGRNLRPGLYVLLLEATQPDGRTLRSRSAVALTTGL